MQFVRLASAVAHISACVHACQVIVLTTVGSVGKTEHLCIVEELHDVFVAFTEMAAMTLIENHHDTRMAYLFYTTAVPPLGDCGIQFLYCGNDNLRRIAIQTPYQLVGVICTVNRTWLKSLVFGLRLSVKVVTVYHEHHLIHIVQL